MNRRTLLATASSALVAGSGAGADIPGAGEPGRAEVILRDGEISVAVAGERVRGTGISVQPDDLWHIGSNTKSMTALLAARLHAAGRVDLDAPLSALVPDAEIHAALQPVTLAELLQHRSGVKANVSMWSHFSLVGTDAERDARADRDLLAARYLPREPDGERGAFTYSNLGYVIAGFALERATGARWESLIAEEVFVPLGLESAGFGPPGAGETDRRAASQPWGHKAFIGTARGTAPLAKADNPPYLSPAGRVHMSARDKGRYLLANLNRDEDFLPGALWSRLHEPVGEETYAMGWGQAPDGSLIHDGSNGMWYCHMRIWPGRGIGYAAFANEARPETSVWMAKAGNSLVSEG
ncbi:MAG: serine hydrolase domain-containing protein [Pseudomonadota bacterium]